MSRPTSALAALAAGVVFALVPLGCGGSECQPACAAAKGHGVAACVKGACDYSCQPGYVDADLDWTPGPSAKSDGCELKCQPANGGVEICDGKDDDCDGKVDDVIPTADTPYFHKDADGDGHGTTSTGEGDVVQACSAPKGYVASADDCDDSDEAIHPGAAETCDGKDDDCDGAVDSPTPAQSPTWYLDADGDGHGTADDTAAGAAVQACGQPAGYVANHDDCDDADATIHPGATETCDGKDDDCDGVIDSPNAVGASWYPDCDGDGFAAADAPPTESCVAPAATPTGCTDSAARWILQAPVDATTTDCDDASANAHPGQKKFFTTPLASPPSGLAYDYDCDGSETPRFSKVGGSCNDLKTCASLSSWVGSRPGCGQSGSFTRCLYGHCLPFVGCTVCFGTSVTRTEACR